MTEEVKNAVFSMHPDKSPGPDGMTPAFYQKYWTIIWNDVFKLVDRLFRDGDINPYLKSTNIVLIPKKKNLRPISLCNVFMKVITKFLVNRMKDLLSNVVSETQSAFIPGRLIADNIMIC